MVMMLSCAKRLCAAGLLLMCAGLMSAQQATDRTVSSSSGEGETVVFRLLGEAKRFHRQGKDKKAARTLKRYIKRNRQAPYVETLREYSLIYDAFSREKPYQGRRRQGASFPFTLDTLASGEAQAVVMRIDAVLNGRPLRLTFDSGSGINLLSPALADSLRLKPLGLKVPFQGEESGEGELAMADELRLGGVVFRHVPFVVADVSTGNDSIDQSLSHLQALLGLPLLEALGSTEIDFRRHVMTLVEPPVTAEPNLEYDDLANELLVRVRHHEEELRLIPDFGASHTVLGADYLLSHQEWIEAYCPKRAIFFAGVNGTTACHEYRFEQFDLQVGRLTFTLPSATVVDVPYDNRLGMDFFSRCQRVIFCFQNMSLLVY